jgi:hypothetical protein
MSAGHANDIFDPRSSPDWDAPLWLSRFVRDELRPWLVQHRQAALDGLGRWLARYSEQQGAKADFVARQNEYLRRLTNEWQARVDQWRKERQRHDRRGLRNLEREWRARKPPGDDWQWRESWRDPADRRLKPALGYVPPDLSEDSKPLVDDLPLPPLPNRDLPPDECWTVLLAVHDEVRHPADRISPTDGIPRPLCWRVRELTKKQRPDLRAMQKAVTAAASPLTSDGQPIPLTPALTPGQPSEGKTRPARVTPPAERAKRAKRPAKKPTIPPKYQKAMKLLPAFKALKEEARARWTVAGFCQWLRHDHYVLFDEEAFSSWYDTYMRLKRRAEEKG